MALFIKKFNKYISKRRPFKENKKEKTRSKRVCYNYGKNGHFIAQCPYERKFEDNDKKKKNDKRYKKDKKFTKKKSYGQAHVGQEWNSSNESFESESDDLTTIAIKGESSLSKSLFPNLSKHTCLMAKEGKKKIKTNAPSSPKYVTSAEDTLSSDDDIVFSDDDEPIPSEFCKNPNAMIKGLMKQVRVRDELLEQQEELLVQERKSNHELKKLLALEKGKVESLNQELALSKETTSSLKSSIDALQGQHDILEKIHQDLEVQFDAIW
jgi:DNA-binding Xre family transcriptional regulator